jgi:hypothetical protein
MFVERMVALAPDGMAILHVNVRLTCAHETRFGEELFADGAVFDVGVPGPDCDGVPLLEGEFWCFCVLNVHL